MRLPVLALTVLAVAAVATLAVVRLRPYTIPRLSQVLPEETEVEIERVPRTYHIVYRDDFRVGREINSSETELWVRRPFDSHVETRSGGRVTGVQVSALTRYSLRGSAATSVLAVPPDAAVSDLRPDAALPAALRRGLIVRREARRVAGRTCRVYRTREAVELGLERPRGDDRYADVCIDAAGLVLEQLVVTDGAPQRLRTALRVDVDASVGDDRFRIGAPTLDAQQGGGSVNRLTPDSQPPGGFLELGRPPDGFRHVGRFSVIPAQPGLLDPTRRGTIMASVADVYTRGPDVLVVDRGGTLQGSAPFSRDDNGIEVQLGAVGRGELLIGLRTSVVRARLDGGRFVRVLGTLPPDDLVRIARSLREVEGSGRLVNAPAP